MKKKRGLQGTIIVMVIVVAAILVVFNLVMKKSNQKEDEKLPTTEKARLLAKDLEESYPATPREVIKLYGRISSCIYNGSLNDKDLKKMIEQERLLYASDYAEANPTEKMLESLKEELKIFHKDKRNVASYTVQKSTEAKYKTVNGQEQATIGASYLLSGNSGYTKVYNQFLLRMEDKQWRIVGYKVVNSFDMDE